MKKIFFAFVMLLLVLALVGCNGNSETPTGDGSPTEQPSAVPDFKFVDENGEACVIAISKSATYVDEFIAQELGKMLLDKTGKEIQTVAEHNLKAEHKYVIFVGSVNDSDAKAVKAGLVERSAAAKTVGNKLIVCFSDKASGSGIIELLASDIEKTDNEVKLTKEYSKIFTLLPTVKELPKLDHSSKTTLDCGRGYKLIHATPVALSKYENYCKDVEAAGFKKGFTRTAQENIFTTFMAQDEYVYVYYSGYDKSMRIVTGPLESFLYGDYRSNLPETVTPYMATIPQPKDGQGYVFALPDGRFIVQDGGYIGDDRVYQTLRELQPSGNITIAAWFISHPHNDHYEGFTDFLKEHSENPSVELERVIYNYAASERYNITGSAGLDNSAQSVEALYAAVEQYAPELPLIRAHTGQIMDFGSVKVEVLYTIEDLLPAKLPNINDSSMVIRLFVEDQTVMMLADTAHAAGPILNKMWGSYLKSDILQIAHHGTYPSVTELYHNIQGELVLYSAMYSNVKWYIKDSRYIEQTTAILLYARDIHVSDKTVSKIELPYTYKDNKEDMLEYISTQ